MVIKRYSLNRNKKEEKFNLQAKINEDLLQMSFRKEISESSRITEFFNDKEEHWRTIEMAQHRFLRFFTSKTLFFMLNEINEHKNNGTIESGIKSNEKRFYKKDIFNTYKENKVISVVVNIIDGRNTNILTKSFIKKDVATFLGRLFIDDASLTILLRQKAEYWADEAIKNLND